MKTAIEFVTESGIAFHSFNFPDIRFHIGEQVWINSFFEFLEPGYLNPYDNSSELPLNENNENPDVIELSELKKEFEKEDQIQFIDDITIEYSKITNEEGEEVGEKILKISYRVSSFGKFQQLTRPINDGTRIQHYGNTR